MIQLLARRRHGRRDAGLKPADIDGGVRSPGETPMTVAELGITPKMGRMSVGTAVGRCSDDSVSASAPRTRPSGVGYTCGRGLPHLLHPSTRRREVGEAVRIRDGETTQRMYLWRAVDHEGEVLDTRRRRGLLR